MNILFLKFPLMLIVMLGVFSARMKSYGSWDEYQAWYPLEHHHLTVVVAHGFSKEKDTRGGYTHILSFSA
nr:unnamed protein product [Callosobruchus chinensis]